MENNLTIYQKLQQIRCEVQKTCNKKSGHNQFANFDYFELKDFLPTVNELLKKYDLISIYNMRANVNSDGTISEVAELLITDGVKDIKFEIPTAEVNSSKNPIQNQGAKITYTRRYLWLTALELVENDMVDAVSGKDKVDPKQMQQDARCEELKKVCSIEELKELCALNGVKKIQELSVDAIRRKIEEEKQEKLDITFEGETF